MLIDNPLKAFMSQVITSIMKEDMTDGAIKLYGEELLSDRIKRKILTHQHFFEEHFDDVVEDIESFYTQVLAGEKDYTSYHPSIFIEYNTNKPELSIIRRNLPLGFYFDFESEWETKKVTLMATSYSFNFDASGTIMIYDGFLLGEDVLDKMKKLDTLRTIT